MRGSIFAQALCGVAFVAAVPLEPRDGPLVDISKFIPHSFDLLSPTVAAAQAGQNNSKPNPEAKPLSSPHVMATSSGSCSNPAIHYEWRDLTEAHRQAYLTAEKCLFGKPSKTGLAGAKNRYEDMQAVHQHLTSSIHGVGQFLPWHRYFQHLHETLLRNECGYTGPMTWWDETKDAGNFKGSILMTPQYFGHAPLKQSNGQGTCITTGKFASTTLDIGPGQTTNNPHCLSRAVDEGLSANINMNFVNSCNSHNNYTDMWQCSYTGPHAYGHDAMGAVMADVDSSPGDPVFFMHHGFIDHNWRIWQNASPSTRLYQINGYTTQNEPAGGWKETSLSTPLQSLGIIPDAIVNDVMDTEGGYLCYKYNY